MSEEGTASAAAIEAKGLDVPCRAATMDEFVVKARALKAAEEAYRQAQLEYAAAVKKLSEEACK